jgi:hypothetical protein
MLYLYKFLLEVLEPNLIELNLSELTSTFFKSIKLNLTRFTALNVLGSWSPWNINNTNPQVTKAHLRNLSLNNFKIIEAMGLKINTSRST